MVYYSKSLKFGIIHTCEKNPSNLNPDCQINLIVKNI